MFSPLFVSSLNDIVVAVMVFCCMTVEGVTLHPDIKGIGSVIWHQTVLWMFFVGSCVVRYFVGDIVSS